MNMKLSPGLLHKLVGLTALWVWMTLLLRFYIGAQLALVDGNSARLGVVSSLGFFTVLSTLLIAFSLGAIFLQNITFPWFALFRHPSIISALATSIILVASVYVLVLRQLWHPQGLRYWVDISLHYLIPSMFVAIWWWLVPAKVLRWRDAIVWAAYPVVYLVVVCALGAVTGFYPYPFVNVAELGWDQVLINSAGLLLLYVIIGELLICINRFGKNHRTC